MNQNSRHVFAGLFLGILFLAVVWVVQAQSGEQSKPTPIRNNNLVGKIAARDLGDSRLTDHFYAFTGTPGDLLITIQSRNLNGDIDVFTATTLRPLLKVSLYAESTAPVTKGIYLRRREDLILRVEARSPNDDEGTYQLFFGGSFEAIAGGEDEAESQAATATNTNPSGRRGTRVNSVGARIAEPTPPPNEIASATPTPEPTPEPTATEAPTPKPTTKKPTPRTTPPQSARSRRPASRRNTPPATSKPAPSTAGTEATTEETKAPEEKPKEDTQTTPAEVATATPPKPRSSRNRPPRSGTTARPVKTPRVKAEPAPTETQQPEVGPRLIIETSDGTLINRSMSTVRRVTVENGLVVILGKDGKYDRVPLANVVKMTIQPQ